MKYGAVAAGEAGAAPGTAVSDLSDELNKNKIAEIKKKIMANRRTRIKGDGDEGDKGLASFADVESDRTKEILSRERQWRTRSSILQSTGKNFQKNIFAILTSVKAREEGKYSKPVAPVNGAPPMVRPGSMA